MFLASRITIAKIFGYKCSWLLLLDDIYLCFCANTNVRLNWSTILLFSGVKKLFWINSCIRLEHYTEGQLLSRKTKVENSMQIISQKEVWLNRLARKKPILFVKKSIPSKSATSLGRKYNVVGYITRDWFSYLLYIE